jgi:hypothetical protein
MLGGSEKRKVQGAHDLACVEKGLEFVEGF